MNPVIPQTEEMGGGEGGRGIGGKEGDWECSGCHNRNYAFRSFCNRCKQPRLLVDTRTPANSKWLPRIGDWICNGGAFIIVKKLVSIRLSFLCFLYVFLVLDGWWACVFFACIFFLAALWVVCVCNGSIGCTNNNYASREKCKKCGQPKELAAMPAVAIPGASVPTHPTYFARVQGGTEQLSNVGFLHPSMSLSSSWPGGGTDQYRNQLSGPYGLQQASNWPLVDSSISGISFAGHTNQPFPVPNSNGWRTGDWICTCGFHNYSSRAQICKKCNAPSSISTPSSLVNSAVTALGTKRLASEEFIHNWDNKRLNAGQQPCSGFESFQIHGDSELNSMYPATASGNTAVPPNWQVNLQVPHVPSIPTLLGKGKQSNGVMGIGCAQIVIITIMPLEQNVIGAKVRERCQLNQ
ncbi:hypothetical protein OROGR_028427 [Orobanche gracilis]